MMNAAPVPLPLYWESRSCSTRPNQPPIQVLSQIGDIPVSRSRPIQRL